MRGHLPVRAVLCASLVALAAGGPALAAQRIEPAKRKLDSRPPVAARVVSGFTPSVAGSSGATARAGAGADLKTFRFTPSGQAGTNKGVTIGLRARPLAVPDARRGSEGTDGYDVGVAVAARGVALTGATSQVDTGMGRREAVSMGLGYGRRDWAAQVRVGEEREDLRGIARDGTDRRYMLEAGGSYMVNRSVALGAGVRYRVAPDQRAAAPRAEDRAAYVGVGVKF